ncbi:hypothetical protein PQR63_20870 [Herbaspirillum rhizosphaerae]|uniref:Uncharacterized protein n=1 Tax=Herbaspirillum rhizosphaerae TaxID=346179 RepID=A0ABW8ZCH8_9BURK
MSASLQEAALPSDISEIEYHLIVAEFDALWGRTRRLNPAESARMDYMICLIEAFEASRGKDSFN